MLEILIWTVFVGTLGTEAVIAGSWVRWLQVLARQQQEEEEEILTPHDSMEIATVSDEQQSTNGSGSPLPKDPRLTGWEYKIVRARRDLFADAAVFKQLCDEEAQAGWILLEKLDNRRVRFKRPIGMREVIQTEFLSYDPYRCHYGPSSNWVNWLGGIAAATALLLPAYLGYALVSSTLAYSRTSAPAQAAPALPAASLSEPDLTQER
jgi:hypothetical protein